MFILHSYLLKYLIVLGFVKIGKVQCFGYKINNFLIKGDVYVVYMYMPTSIEYVS